MTLYQFVASESGSFSANLTNLSTDLRLFLVEDIDNNVALTASDRGGTADEFVSWQVVAGNTYYLWIASDGEAETQYNLDLSAR